MRYIEWFFFFFFFFFLSRGSMVMLPITLGYSYPFKTTQFLHFALPFNFHIFVVGDIKFGRRVNHSKSQPMTNRP